MEWEPITQEQLDAMLRSCASAMSEASQALFRHYEVQPYKLPCLRTAVSGIETVFVIARADTAVLIYDDVEEEFGVGVVTGTGVLETWQLYGPLEIATIKFVKLVSTPMQ